jgi:assimilatory nitrate reductase catalytic subunit
VNFKDTEEVFKEMVQLTKGRPCDYAGINYEMIEKQGGIQWPAPEGKTEGTKRMYADWIFNTRDGKANIICVEDNPLPEPPDIDYPFILNTGRVIEHWHTGTKTRKVPELNALLPTAYVEINSVDASILNIKYGDKVEITSRRGKVVTWARVTTCIKRETVFMPFFDGDMPANNLTLNVIDKISSEPNYKQAAVNVRKLS